jgi:hypothetical protein
MCHTFNGKNWDRVATDNDLEIISNFYSTLPTNLVQKIFKAMRSYGSIKPIALAFVCELVKGKLSDSGVPNFGFFMPFSGMSLDGGLIRYQTPVIVECHNAWASFSMGQRSKEALISLLRTFNVELMELHDCGCISTDPDLALTSEFDRLYYEVNMFRSFAESAGYPVVTIESFDNIITDMTPQSITSYANIAKVLGLLTDSPMSVVPSHILSAQRTVKQLFASRSLIA